MSDEFTVTLNNPLTEEQWDMINDVDFDRTDRITFHTKHGKDVEFAKVRHGKWFYKDDDMEFYDTYTCSECDFEITVDSEERCDMGVVIEDVLYCPHCGSRNVVETWNVPDWRKKDDER